MVATRSQTRAKKSRAATYRARIRASHCRRLGPATCRRKPGCKRASGSKRSFCRKSKNQHA